MNGIDKVGLVLKWHKNELTFSGTSAAPHECKGPAVCP